MKDLEQHLESGGVVSGRQAAEYAGTYPARANVYAEENDLPRLGLDGAYLWDLDAILDFAQELETEANEDLAANESDPDIDGDVSASGGSDDDDPSDEDRDDDELDEDQDDENLDEDDDDEE